MTTQTSLRRTALHAAAPLLVAIALAGCGDDSSGSSSGGARPNARGFYTLVGGQVQKIKVTEGDTVKLQVTSPVDEELHVHGYDRAVDLPAGKREQVSFKANLTGVFEVEFENASQQLAELTVEPR